MNDRNKAMKPAKPATPFSSATNGYARYPIPPEEIPNIDDLVIEDQKPVDNYFVEKQYRLLTEPLDISWKPEGHTFQVVANVGLFYAANKPPLVPDVMLSLDVPVKASSKRKQTNSYFTWIVGKPPDVVVEIVSDRRGGEEGFKKDEYAKIGVQYYVIFDPNNLLKGGTLRAFALGRRAYRHIKPAWLPRVGLGLTLWRSEYRGMDETWLRWCDHGGILIPTGDERAEQADQRAEQLAAQLRALGIEPKS